MQLICQLANEIKLESSKTDTLYTVWQNSVRKLLQEQFIYFYDVHQTQQRKNHERSGVGNCLTVMKTTKPPNIYSIALTCTVCILRGLIQKKM